MHQTKACDENEETHNIDSMSDMKKERECNSTDNAKDNEKILTTYI
jgi:hypothetical protein